LLSAHHGGATKERSNAAPQLSLEAFEGRKRNPRLLQEYALVAAVAGSGCGEETK